ncbi:MAG TPA: exo-alpha-sialidase [bacterium]|nr:exo-alpha-sialidase [bacterium]
MLIGLLIFLISFMEAGVMYAQGQSDSPAIVQSGFVYDEAPFPSCHASTLVEVSQGKILAAWFGGTEEGKPDVGIWLSRYDGYSWEPVRQVAKADGVPCWNPVLFQAENGETLLFYKAGRSPMEWSGLLIRSKDDGDTWSEPELLPGGILGPIKNKPIQLEDGTLVCGSSVESWKLWTCWVELTRDLGKTWSKHGPIQVPGQPFGIIQPTVFLTRDGKIRMLCRARQIIGKICLSESKDGGNTWSDARPIDVPNPNSGIDAVRMKDGRIAMVYNHTGTGRSPINLGISNDDGETWKMVLTLEDQPGEYSYPAIIQTGDGLLHTTYTWKREKIKHVAIDPNRF